jgi:threonine dehydratase
MTHTPPDLQAVKALRETLGSKIVRTPTIRCAGIEDELGNGTSVFGKLEFLQHTGTFKASGALAAVSTLDKEQLATGITAVSAGNHAIAAAFAAREAGTHAKVVMIASANPVRIAACREYGGDIIMAENAHLAFELAEQVQREEGRFLVHPFDGPDIATGTGTVGLEISEQVDEFDAVIVSIGGGGLIGGISNVLKQLRPDCKVFGVEAEGADSMHRSFAAGKAKSIEKVRTIADSLGAPFATPYSYSLCRENVDQLAMVSDRDLQETMGFLYKHMKIAVEPACVAAAAALLGPLREQLQGQKVVLVFCGSNIDWPTWQEQAILD